MIVLLYVTPDIQVAVNIVELEIPWTSLLFALIIIGIVFVLFFAAFIIILCRGDSSPPRFVACARALSPLARIPQYPVSALLLFLSHSSPRAMLLARVAPSQPTLLSSFHSPFSAFPPRELPHPVFPASYHHRAPQTPCAQ